MMYIIIFLSCCFTAIVHKYLKGYFNFPLAARLGFGLYLLYVAYDVSTNPLKYNALSPEYLGDTPLLLNLLTIGSIAVAIALQFNFSQRLASWILLVFYGVAYPIMTMNHISVDEGISTNLLSIITMIIAMFFCIFWIYTFGIKNFRK